ncbi:MAG: toll/interleukin-1 receptor domain-containing protein [Caulobacteraceae bacterium]
MDGGQRYWAFLSYSHADRKWANWLHHALETYAIPRRLVGRQTPAGPAPGRLRPLFKDREELAANPDLRERVHAALAGSSALIVICSPAAARSAWVEDEIVRFKALHGETRVFAVIAAGTPGASAEGRGEDECFPPALRFRVDSAGALTDQRAEVIAADLRPQGDGRRLARLKLIAGILGFDLDELVQRDAQRRVRRRTALAAASLVVALAMGGLALAALAARDEARAQRTQAEGLVEFMLVDLRKKLEPTGRLDALDAVGAKAMSYYSAQARRGLDADALGRRARVLHLLGDLRDQRGDFDGALKDFQQASAATAELLARQPGDTGRIFNHAQSVYYVGYVADQRGENQTAETRYLEYRRLADQLVALEPARDAWRLEVGYANANLGTLLMREGRADLAADAFSKVLAIDAALTAKAPADRERQIALAGTYAWLADVEVMRGRLDAAMRDRRAQRAVYEKMLGRPGGDNAAKELLVVNGVGIGNILALQGRSADAVPEFQRSATLAEAFIALTPDNVIYRQDSVFAFTALARALLSRGDLAAAGHAADRGLSIAEGLVRRDPSVVDWRGELLGGARVLKIKIAAQAARSDRELREALAPSPAESERLSRLAGQGPANVRLARIAAEAALLAGDFESLSGRQDAARARWGETVRLSEKNGLALASRGGDSSQLAYARALARLGAERPNARVASDGSGPTPRVSANRPRIGDYAW